LVLLWIKDSSSNFIEGELSTQKSKSNTVAFNLQTYLNIQDYPNISSNVSGCLIRGRNCLAVASTWYLVVSVLLVVLVFCVLLCFVVLCCVVFVVFCCIVLCCVLDLFCFVFIFFLLVFDQCLLCPMLPVSLDCPFFGVFLRLFEFQCGDIYCMLRCLYYINNKAMHSQISVYKRYL
jgi:hypothetical protein